MFTGIIESTGKIVDIKKNGDNIDFTIESELAKDAYIDQSISHNGVCLTVVRIDNDTYTVTAIKETLDVTNLSSWEIGTKVNLERSMLPGTRLDGHFVQGHVDTITTCIAVEPLDGSWYFSFRLPEKHSALIVHKGSIAINGTSLTVIHPNSTDIFFRVAIIPYTFEHTNFKQIKPGDKVNLEFDILGKYVERQLSKRTNNE
jgi:riboflavin synthase